MDIELARTFLEIVSTKSFVRAAERLNIGQTTVSARIRTLEQELGRPLFVRNKSGATLTPAGEQFLRYAPTFVQLWQRALHQMALPPGRRAMLSVGAEVSLWHPLLLRLGPLDTPRAAGYRAPRPRRCAAGPDESSRLRPYRRRDHVCAATTGRA